MVTEQDYPRIPEKFRLVIPKYRPREETDHDRNLREIERWGNALPSNASALVLANRPTSPVDGTIVYLIDTDQLVVWDGTQWRLIWPAVTTRTAGAAITTAGTAESTIAAVSISAVNYPYQVRVVAVVFHTQTVAGDSFALRIKNSATIVGLTRGNASVETLVCEDVISVPGGGAITVNVVLARAAGAGTSSTFADGTANYVLTTIEPI